MPWKIVQHPLIQHDFNEAYAWYEDQQKGLGERFAEAVKQKLDRIELSPELFGSRSSTSHREVKLDGFPYLIVYRIFKRDGIILITSIHHTKKHPRKKYGRK